MIKVSVIIPIYNVASYITRCVSSLFSQTLDNIEYIFVDDCSTDESISLLKKTISLYPERESFVRIISHKKNSGVAKSRTSGILAASGLFLIHCDPDDYMEPEMLELMYKKAIDSKADIVCCNYIIENQNSHIEVKKRISDTPKECLKKLYKKHRDINSLCDKLVSRNLILENNILPFKNCDFGEDLGCIVRILYYARKISHIDKPLYHYEQRDKSISHQTSLYYLTMRMKLLENIESFLNSVNFSNKKMLCFLKFSTKLAYKNFLPKKEWYSLYKDSHKYIFSYNIYSFKSRIVLWLTLIFMRFK